MNNKYLFFRKSLALVMGLCLITFQFTGCGQNDPQTNFTGSGTNTQSNTPGWNPPPVAATCTAGDADHDGSCDNVDPNVSSSDSDNDGNLDGLDMTPAGAGSGHSSDDGISPLGWGLIGIGTYLLGSALYNSLQEECTIDSTATYCIVRANWDNANNYMTISEASGQGKLKVHLDAVEVNKAYWLAFGSGAIMDNLTCKADMVFTHNLNGALADAPSGVLGFDTVWPSTLSTEYNYVTDSAPFVYNQSAPAGKVNALVATTAMRTQVNPDGGCDGDGITLRCGANMFCMEKSQAGTQNMPFQGSNPVTVKVEFRNTNGANAHNKAYDPSKILLYNDEGLVKLPQGWYRDNAPGFEFDVNSALKGKWKPFVQ